MIRLILVVLAVAALVGLGITERELRRPYRGYSGTQILEIEPGTRATELARLLVDRGVLRHRWPFLLRYWIDRAHHSLKAGEYLFDLPLTPIDVYRKLVRGEVYLHPVVVPEGSDRFDIAQILHAQLGMNADDFLRVTQQVGPVQDLDPQAPTLEGYLFPDTYRFPRGITPAAAAFAMLARFRHVLEPLLRGQAQAPPRPLRGVITLASLVEKETSAPDERPLIAGVFARRMEKKMPLQCDPTVVYALRLNHLPVGTITRSDLEFDSPYNTYRAAGLPPGPICNPGEASIRAALHPAPGNLFYFVSNNHGGHLFARTLAEHQRNVARYRREVAALRRGIPEGKHHAR